MTGKPITSEPNRITSHQKSCSCWSRRSRAHLIQKDTVLFFHGAGTPERLLEDIAAQVQHDASSFTKSRAALELIGTKKMAHFRR